MKSNPGAALLSADVRAVKARLECLTRDQGGGPVRVGFNTLATACAIDRRRTQDAMRLLLALGVVSTVAPADQSTGTPASYRVNPILAGGA
jgi:hypothetical protein